MQSNKSKGDRLDSQEIRLIDKIKNYAANLQFYEYEYEPTL